MQCLLCGLAQGEKKWELSAAEAQRCLRHLPTLYIDKGKCTTLLFHLRKWDLNSETVRLCKEVEKFIIQTAVKSFFLPDRSSRLRILTVIWSGSQTRLEIGL